MYPEQWNNNPLGYIVYKRTYSRWLEDQERREKWSETVRRVVDYSRSLSPIDETEAFDLFDYIFNLKIFPAGRTLWVGGTKPAQLYPLANFNCSYIDIDGLNKFCEMFFVLLLGVGVGFGVKKDVVSSLPFFYKNKKVVHIPYFFNNIKKESTSVYTTDGGKSITVVVGDSKEGWVDALRIFLNFLSTKQSETIVFDYSHVRPSGYPLKTFGGYASGPGALAEMFDNILFVVSQSSEEKFKLKPIQVMDIANSIAKAVVVGGVRRSSQICLFDDEEIATAKVNLYTDPEKKPYLFRSQSNNSWILEENPGFYWFKDALNTILTNYEPGFINLAEMKRRRPNAKGVNPCSEIILDDRGVCNLTEVNLAAFVKNGEFSPDIYKGLWLATRVGLRQTLVRFHNLLEWDYRQQRDRLLGVSLTGIMDAFDSSKYSWQEFMKYLYLFRRFVRDTADRYADKLNVNRPLLVTTVKPSGTISQLAGVSSGCHRRFAPQYWRRIRVSKNDPTALALVCFGYTPYPEGVFKHEFLAMDDNSKKDLIDKADTWVFEFGITSNTKKRAADESAVDQLKRYIDLQNHWSDHNTSITVQFSESEVDEVADFLANNWDNGLVGVSFMVKDTSHYPLMPYEEDKNVALSYIGDLLAFDRILDNTELKKRQDLYSFEYEDNSQECAGGACPVR
jgi:adenosylcobalamin-dependent ribonucleoside-triphosphate reductase